MWSAHSYYMVEVMLVRYVNINARCRALGVLVPLACAVRGNLADLGPPKPGFPDLGKFFSDLVPDFST